ncbi:Lrp/AsnC family transcriptional regulator [Thermodesulfobacterium sp. TA1]|uniref:Lrp/AsnC family transcriptional regulator n=1 Tax=Thermodesulfobacterium sp. TA1 TaxID=2234087 RepID=UPI0012319761|nr:Lrp/AsnC family transcriptional regulator [Thermodesulfobacterium sp. TA1]QER41544.1 Lrp/AsnC family transcriptional regulator [Thermodesulfobacterium sp. TA1]
MEKKFCISQEQEKALLNLLQQDFPIEERPFQGLAQKLNLSEKTIIEVLINLHNKGIIRHFGATVNSVKLGYFTCLCAASIPKDKINIAFEIAELPEVTHAYLREHRLNFWFTVVTPSESKFQDLINTLTQKYLIEIKTFPAIKKFKAKAVFNL